MAGDGFRLTFEGARGELVLDRPPANVLDIGTLQALTSALESAAARDFQLLTLSGKPHFCAGVDIADHVPEKTGEMLAAIHGFLRALLDFPAVTVARLTGACLGGGAEIALACDLRFAAEDARIGFPEIGLACFPPAAAILLPLQVGPGKAAELILSGEPVTAAEAERIGLVDRSGNLEAIAGGFTESLLSRSPAAVSAARELLRRPRRELFDRHRASVEEAYRELSKSNDLALAVEAFLRRKSPSV